MLYAIAAICVCLVILALIGKPIRIEIIHTVTPQPIPPEVLVKQEEAKAAAKAGMDALLYMNEAFHNVEVGEKNDPAKV